MPEAPREPPPAASPVEASAAPQAAPAPPVPAPPALLASAGAAPALARGRRRRGPRVKFTRWLYGVDLYRQLGVSPRGQALVCRELRAEPDGSWSARIAAVPQGFFEPTWVAVPPEVVVPVARPKPASLAR